MKNIANRLSVFAAVALFCGTVAYGQTTLKANVPFGFRIPGGTVPAGHYQIQLKNTGSGTIVQMWDFETRRSAMSVGFLLSDHPRTPVVPRLEFQCGAAGCALSRIWTLNGGVGVPINHSRRYEYTASIPLGVANGD